jgi:hypothetical protein
LDSPRRNAINSDAMLPTTAAIARKIGGRALAGVPHSANAAMTTNAIGHTSGMVAET